MKQHMAPGSELGAIFIKKVILVNNIKVFTLKGEALLNLSK